MEGMIVATKWFAQRLEWLLTGVHPHNGVSGQARRWDREKNSDILIEAEMKIEELKEALELGVNVQEKCFEIGACALMIAHNVEAGKGEDEVVPEPKKVKKKK